MTDVPLANENRRSANVCGLCKTNSTTYAHMRVAAHAEPVLCKRANDLRIRREREDMEDTKKASTA